MKELITTQNTIAKFQYLEGDFMYYRTEVLTNDRIRCIQPVYFKIPMTSITGVMPNSIESKNLINWILEDFSSYKFMVSSY